MCSCIAVRVVLHAVHLGNAAESATTTSAAAAAAVATSADLCHYDDDDGYVRNPHWENLGHSAKL